MAPYGPLWFLMASYDPLWFLMVPYGSLWLVMAPYGPLWLLMAPYGSLWLLMASYGSLWPPYGPLWLIILWPRKLARTSQFHVTQFWQISAFVLKKVLRQSFSRDITRCTHEKGVLHAALQTKHRIAVTCCDFDASLLQKKTLSGTNSQQHESATSMLRVCCVSLNIVLCMSVLSQTHVACMCAAYIPRIMSVNQKCLCAIQWLSHTHGVRWKSYIG